MCHAQHFLRQHLILLLPQVVRMDTPALLEKYLIFTLFTLFNTQDLILPFLYSIYNLFFLAVVWPANGKKPLRRLWC